MDKKLYPRIGEEVIWVTLDNGLPVCIVPKKGCLLYTSPSPRDGLLSRMPSSA